MAGRFRIRTGVDIIEIARVAGHTAEDKIFPGIFARKEQRQLAARNSTARHLAARLRAKKRSLNFRNGDGAALLERVEIPFPAGRRTPRFICTARQGGQGTFLVDVPCR